MASGALSPAALRKRNLLICLCLGVATIAVTQHLSRSTFGVSTGRNRRVAPAGLHYATGRSSTSEEGRLEMDVYPPLRVFVYDLPRRFTFGLIEEYYNARGLQEGDPKADAVPAYPAHQHASEWWLFQSLFTPAELRAAARGENTLSTTTQRSKRRKALQVSGDPQEALGDPFPTPGNASETFGSARGNPESAREFPGNELSPETGATPRRKSLAALSASTRARRRSAYAAQHVPSSAAVRVTSPEEADVIFVPFFSSLSLNVLPLDKVRRKGADVAGYDDVAAQRELMTWVEGQDAWKRSGGRDHVFVVSDPNAMSEVHDRTKNSILLVADFGRMQPDQASLQRDVVIPYVHRVPTYTPQDEKANPSERNLLLFFAGNRWRKEGGAIRTKLFEVLAEEDSVSMMEGIPSREGRRAAMKGMRTSKFCLSPAGDTPSACRLFDAIVNLCVPVIVSDSIELPFEDRLDYTKFVLVIPEARALQPGYVAQILRSEVANGRWESMMRHLREVRSLFEYSEPYGAIDMVWDKIATKVPAIREAINRDRRMAEGTA